MSLVAISNVKNEQDIVEAFVRHTGALVDHHLVLDNGSTDGTREILDALVSEGFALSVVDDPSPGAWQARRMTALMHRAAEEFDPDWVLPLDADEFIVTAAGSTVAEVLDRHRVPVLIPWRTYVPDTSDPAEELNPVAQIGHRLADEGHRWVKVMVPASAIPGSTLDQGSHDLTPGPGVTEERDQEDDLWLAHFPIRSAAQYARKVAVGKIQYYARQTPPGLAFHYEEPLALLMRDWEEFAATYRQAAARFALPAGASVDPRLVHDPIPYAGGPLRHTRPPRPGEPWVTILEYTIQLAEEVRRLSDDADLA